MASNANPFQFWIDVDSGKNVNKPTPSYPKGLHTEIKKGQLLHRCPVPESRVAPVRHSRNPRLAGQPPQLLVIERLPTPAGEHQRTGSLAECLRHLKNHQGATAQRHPVSAVRLHPPGRDGPYTGVPVGLRPPCLPHLTPERRRQYPELEGQFRGRQCRRRQHRPNGCSHLPLGHGPQVLDHVMLRTQDRSDPVAGTDPVLSMATAHSRTARRRWRTRQALDAFRWKIGVTISNESALVTWETVIVPMRRQHVAVGRPWVAPRKNRIQA